MLVEEEADVEGDAAMAHADGQPHLPQGPKQPDCGGSFRARFVTLSHPGGCARDVLSGNVRKYSLFRPAA
jgi:hypothetical protein